MRTTTFTGLVGALAILASGCYAGIDPSTAKDSAGGADDGRIYIVPDLREPEREHFLADLRNERVASGLVFEYRHKVQTVKGVVQGRKVRTG